MSEIEYTLVINHGKGRGYDVFTLDKKDFLRRTSSLLKKPEKLFLGLGDFLEIGDYNQLLDSIFFDEEGVSLENLLDSVNRKLSDEENIPFSFLKLAVYYPDFLLKDVPIPCVSTIGKKARLFPGAKTFVKYIKEYEPLVLSAVPYEITIEFIKRLGLNEQNLISTEYKIDNESSKYRIYAGNINRFVSGNRKSIEIEKYMAKVGLRDEEIVYIGRGEAGANTFSTVNSVAFNPSFSIIPYSRITLYGSSLESLLVLFNFDGELEKFLLSDTIEEYLPSLVVYSDTKDKDDSLINMELEHRRLQNNIIGQRIEHSEDSYNTVERDIEITYGGSVVNIKEVRNMIRERMEKYQKDPEKFINEICDIAKERYKSFHIL